MRQQSFIYNLPIYCSDILFVYYKDYRYANKVFEKYGFETKTDTDAKGLCGYEEVEIDGKGVMKFYLLVRETDESIENILVHETFHLTQDILEHKGIKFQKKGANEAYTYLQAWLYDQFLKKINAWKK